MRLIGCTTATRSHRAGADVVAASWSRFHPEAPFWILLADADHATDGPPAPHVLYPEDLGLSLLELRRRQTIYSAFEYTTSLKADLLRHFLVAGADAVVFSDADTCIYGPLDDLAQIACARGLALTPHVLTPLPADGHSQSELELLAMGIFNTGLVAAGTAGVPALEWWASRLRRDCLDRWSDGFFVEQRWMDLVPTYFDYGLARDPGLNVAFWNLHERPPRRDGAELLVGERPLRHLHFSGFDPEQPERICNHPMTRSMRLQMRDVLPIASAYRDYADAILQGGHRELRQGGYRFGRSSSGRPLVTWERLLLREALLAAEAGAGPLPPDPFAPADAARLDRFLRIDDLPRDLSAPARHRIRHAYASLGGGRPARLPARVRTRLAELRHGERAVAVPSDEVRSEYPSTTARMAA